MIPALVSDSQIITAWKDAGRVYTADSTLPWKALLQCHEVLNASQSAMDSSTPPSVRSFFAYHQWRIRFNWETIIDNLSGGRSVHSLHPYSL